MGTDQDIVVFQNFFFVFLDVLVFVKKEEVGLFDLLEDDIELGGCVVDDLEIDNNDLYLLDCRICFVGFDVFDVRKLVVMVRKGGGFRYMLWSERLIYIVVGVLLDV